LIALAQNAYCMPRQNDKGEADLTSLPKEVREAVDRAGRDYVQPLKNAKWSKVNRLPGSEHTLYRLQGTNGRGNRIEIEITAAGRIIEVEEHGIPLAEVPNAVIAALKARKPEFKPSVVEAIYQVDKNHPSAYGFEGVDSSGRKIEVYISADGKTFLN